MRNEQSPKGAPAGKPRTPALPAPERRTITLAGQETPYVLKTSARARRVRLVMRPASGLEVVVPRGTRLADIERVLREQVAWIAATSARLAERPAAPAPPPLETGRVLPYAGASVRLVIGEGAPVGRFRAALRDDALTLTVAVAEPGTIRAALETWYRRQARALFAERIEHANLAFGFRYGRVSIKDQKSRWGSCSTKGNLNFNWRLLLAPSDVLDYVVVHELAHLKIQNHSPQFWALVATACPEFRVHRRWLRQHGHELRF